MKVTAKITEAFFDRDAVLTKVGAARAKALAKAGAYVRRRAQWSMPTRKKPAPPGKPPHSHKGHLKKLLFFAFDDRTQSVVVGPTPFGMVGNVPPVLEYGGRARIRNPNRRVRRIGRVGEILLDVPPRTESDKVTSTRDPITGRWVRYAPIRTAAQARRANELNAELYGEMWLPGAEVEARPYMRPALAEEMPRFPDLFADSIR